MLDVFGRKRLKSCYNRVKCVDACKPTAHQYEIVSLVTPTHMIKKNPFGGFFVGVWGLASGMGWYKIEGTRFYRKRNYFCLAYYLFTFVL